ncbi:hypothetical protein PRIPAC_71120 [Pristionchus pacificus]|uniref:Uncharacterized protein n=1 Tax=Pristionchus pacificus TaxID=54126 RepID=A0A2A6C5N3_PRIPA|nr:hypothetical protein PRIPAC_71120 [Pristionchus pacificus]|eukprot:PDM73495.1 hypothetical protein PRIPAC_40851 [Pristionchus pacificus]
MIPYIDDRELYSDEELAEFARQAKLVPRPTPEQNMISLKWVSMLGAISLCYPIVVLHLSRWMSYELKVDTLIYSCYPLTLAMILIGWIRLYCCEDMIWKIWNDEEESADGKKDD